MRNKHHETKTEYPELIKINANSLVIYKPRTTFHGQQQYIEKLCTEETTSLGNKKTLTASNKTNGFLSARAGNRLRTYIKYLIWTSGCFKMQGQKLCLRMSGKISFLTLTLSAPQQHTDQYIKAKMLNQFITELNKKFIGIRYIWRAEKQKNGNIHFHFLVNKYIPYLWLRMVWNRIQEKEGYIALYQDKFKNMWWETYLKQIQNFNIDKLPKYKLAFETGKKEGWKNPNSTDVVSLKETKKALYYISKYITKNNHETYNLPKEVTELLKIEGHIYYCSAELMAIEPPREMLSAKILHDYEIIKKKTPDSIFYEDFFILIKKPIEELFNMGCYHLYNLFISCFNVLNKNELFTP